MGDVRLVIEQISGQTWEGRAFRTELVESLKALSPGMPSDGQHAGRKFGWAALGCCFVDGA